MMNTEEEIEEISKNFMRMYPVKDIVFKKVLDNLEKLDYEDCMEYQEKLLRSTVQHPTVRKYPPATSYCQRFIKRLITEIEEINLEVYDGLYETYTNFLLLTDANNQKGSISYCHKTYFLAPDLAITLKESQNIISEGTTGMFTWQASHVLANWCQEEASRFCGKNILELGAGLGFTGLTIVKKCNPASYIFTDLHTSVLKTLRENVLINLCNGRNYETTDDMIHSFKVSYKDTSVLVEKLDWTTDKVQAFCDVILAADVVYDTDIIPPLVAILKDSLCKKAGATAYVASTIRNQETFNCFRSTLESNNVKILSESHHTYREAPSQPESSVVITEMSL